MKLKKPQNGKGWSFLTKSLSCVTSPHMAYRHQNGTTVISDIVKTQRGYEYHLSITKNGKFPSPRAVRRVQKDFNVEDFERDDHSILIASLWLPLNKDKRGDCECK